MVTDAFLEALSDLAVEAGAAILRLYEDPAACTAAAKADGSPVTAADHAAEAIIEAGLAALAPAVCVVAEEAVADGRIPAAAPRFFLVDPLDGTREFVARNGEFTVNIALVEDGLPAAGVVFAPPWASWVGAAGLRASAATVTEHCRGAWRPLSVRPPPADGLDVIASRAQFTGPTAEFLRRFRVRRRVAAGSSLGFCRIAEGAADLYPRFAPTNEWDTAAGHAVLAAAGGGVRRADGGPLTYGKRDAAGRPLFLNPSFVAFGGFDPFAEPTAGS